jgi:hypothetical protein
VGAREGKGREKGARAGKELGLGLAHTGRKGREGKGPKRKRREERGGEWAAGRELAQGKRGRVWAAFPFSSLFFFSFSFLHSNYSNKSI